MAKPAFSVDDLKETLPRLNETLTLSGVNGDIQILRDTFGIPHIRGETTHDAFFGQGFATAQDRLWHMDYDRRRAYGRWAEFVGMSGVAHDKQMRSFQLEASAKIDWGVLDDDTKAMFEAYAAGVNAYIDSIEVLPIEYQVTDTTPDHWTVIDSLAVFKVRHIYMGVFESKLWRAQLVNELGSAQAAQLLSGYQPGHLVISPTGAEYSGSGIDGRKELQAGLAGIEWFKDDDAGSNNWALDGNRTASGKPLIAGDPHRGLDVPNVYYQNHISGPAFDVLGLSFPGCPGFPHFGHNQNVAWCITHAGADYQDLYVEKLRATNGSIEYAFEDQWLPAEIRSEYIKIRGGKPVEIEVPVTHHGPLISRSVNGTKGIAFRYTATATPNRGYECMLKMLLATNADQIEESMRQWVDPCNNFVFGDTAGNIGYLNRGKVPIRPIDNAWLPVPGWTGEYEWKGEIPFEELPRINNPQNGLIVTANNRIVDEDYQYYIALDFAPEYRARRIYDRLNEITEATVSDMEDVHADIVSIPAQIYSKIIARTEHHDDKLVQIAKTHMLGWDGVMDRDLVAPTIYSAFRRQLHRKVFRHVFGALADEALVSGGRGAPGHLRQLGSQLVTHAQTDDESLLPQGTNWDSLITDAFADGVNELIMALGDEVSNWVWGAVHRTNPVHPLSSTFPDIAQYLDPPSVPMSGDGDTPQAGSFSDSKPYDMTGMSVARYVWDTSDWDNSKWAVPLGASGHPGSIHYSDQISVWSNVELIPATYSWDKIETGSENRQTIKAERAIDSSIGIERLD